MANKKNEILLSKKKNEIFQNPPILPKKKNTDKISTETQISFKPKTSWCAITYSDIRNSVSLNFLLHPRDIHRQFLNKYLLPILGHLYFLQQQTIKQHKIIEEKTKSVLHIEEFDRGNKIKTFNS